jgi:hypothetical protein
MACIRDDISFVHIIFVTTRKHNRFRAFTFPTTDPGLAGPMDTSFGKRRTIFKPGAFFDARNFTEDALSHAIPQIVADQIG